MGAYATNLISKYLTHCRKRGCSAHYRSVQFSSVDMWDDSAEILFRSFFCCIFVGDPCKQFWHGQGCPLFDFVNPAFPLPTTSSPIPQGALKVSFGEAVMPVTCPKHASFRLLIAARTGSCGTRKLILLLRTQSLVLCPKYEIRRSFLYALGFQNLSKPTDEKFDKKCCIARVFGRFTGTIFCLTRLSPTWPHP